MDMVVYCFGGEHWTGMFHRLNQKYISREGIVLSNVNGLRSVVRGGHCREPVSDGTALSKLISKQVLELT